MATSINIPDESQYESGITTKPMLETAEENFVHLPFCQSLTEPTIIERKELTEIPNSHSFTLENLLTPEECEFYIQEC